MPPLPVDFTPGSYAESDPDGHYVLNRTLLVPNTAGGVSIPGASVATPLSNFEAPPNLGFMQKIRAVCTIAPGADGNLDVLDGPTASNVLIYLPIHNGMPVGEIIEVEFATPLKSQIGKPFAISSDPNTGTWLIFVNGFIMDSTTLR